MEWNSVPKRNRGEGRGGDSDRRRRRRDKVARELV